MPALAGERARRAEAQTHTFPDLSISSHLNAHTHPPRTTATSSVSHRAFACNAGLGRPPPPEIVIAYGPDRLDAFLAAADELEDRFPGLVVTGVEYGGGGGAAAAAAPAAFEVTPPRPARSGGDGVAEEEAVASGAGPTLWSGLALGRAPGPGELAALLASAGVGSGPGADPADGVGCGG